MGPRFDADSELSNSETFYEQNIWWFATITNDHRTCNCLKYVSLTEIEPAILSDFCAAATRCSQLGSNDH